GMMIRNMYYSFFYDTSLTEYEFDSLRRLIRICSFYNGLAVDTTIITYDNIGRIKTRSFNSASFTKDVHYDYDSANRISFVKTFNAGMIVTDRYIYSVDQHGHEPVIKLTYRDNQHTETTVSLFSPSGQLLQEEIHRHTAPRIRRRIHGGYISLSRYTKTRFEYDLNGNCISEQRSYSKHSTGSEIKWYTDKVGRLIRKEYYTNGKLDRTKYYIYK
ncbi:MAG TPA: hypothetical protein VI731_09700, partial [Bacteroidia bacterium]|nr:hypothetical protein [Bacteroidia bacterium]